MNNRVMRLIVFFDLPSVTTKDLTEYRNFRRFLLKNGFIMMQESIYSKLVLNNNSSALLRKQINKNLPSRGIVQLMQITEKQYSNIEYLIGKPETNVINSDKRIIEL